MNAVLKATTSSTPTLRRWFERAGWFLFLLIGLAAFALSACGPIRARPDLKRSTLTQPDSDRCVRGRKAIPAGNVGLPGYPVVVVLDEPCEAKP